MWFELDKDKMFQRRKEEGVSGSCIAELQVRWQGHLAKAPVLDLMDGTNCRLFFLVTFKSLSLLHGHADFYGHLRQSAGAPVFRSAGWERTEGGDGADVRPFFLRGFIAQKNVDVFHTSNSFLAEYLV